LTFVFHKALREPSTIKDYLNGQRHRHEPNMYKRFGSGTGIRTLNLAVNTFAASVAV